MKLTVGVLAVLLLVTAAVVGQQSQLPFPMAANPSLANGTTAETSSLAGDRRQDLPSSMAANQTSTTAEASPAVPAVRNEIDTESPFPTAANPARIWGSSTTAETSPSVGERHHKVDNESPFPMAANPW
jgi:hypothetical protein